ncbi:hypothetical protein ACWC98_11025 [Streptomyces goshikiensis]|uniref:hypothetical protein n=1 Tax=Streptomyces goshikiensis TaxID=1942 RepID=UPI003327B462
MTVIGCPFLEQLVGDAAVGGSLDFPNKAKAQFLYSGSPDSEIAEELYSDTAPKLAAGTKRIFDAMIGCPVYQATSSGVPMLASPRRVATSPRARVAIGAGRTTSEVPNGMEMTSWSMWTSSTASWLMVETFCA